MMEKLETVIENNSLQRVIFNAERCVRIYVQKLEDIGKQKDNSFWVCVIEMGASTIDIGPRFYERESGEFTAEEECQSFLMTVEELIKRLSNL